MCVTTGLTKNCTIKRTGGSSGLWIANRTDVDTIVQDPTGEVTTVNMVSAAVFYKVEFSSNQSNFNETTGETGEVIQQYTFVSDSRYQEQRNFIQSLIGCGCGFVVIHRENTGKTWFWGFEEGEEANLFSNVGDSGTAKADPNQETVILQASATIKANEFTGTIPV
ncbi:hypothetical protein AB832_06990 [Flavobacteriaceae bacterium (ex Bugula neritina AB1)]|nr:hypothetical protein AB832_06990 [Flavobacteriaceae bacterium (ex Bugula neritina AB1)]